jgi:hypothetical protein
MRSEAVLRKSKKKRKSVVDFNWEAAITILIDLRLLHAFSMYNEQLASSSSSSSSSLLGGCESLSQETYEI